MSFSTLPPEICGAICAEVKELRGNLAVLCTTSRNFCREAQRILYHSVDLQGREMRAAKSWAYTVTEHTHLAERMHALTLQLPGIESLDASDVAKIMKALSRCINLKELRGVPECTIREYPFRLHKFESLAPFLARWDDNFWKTQTEIRVLSLLYFPPSLENQLPVPNLIALRIDHLHTLPERPLQRVETGFHTDLTPLARYSRTLTTLNLRGEWHLSPIVQILADIVASVPSLLHLGLIELQKHHILNNFVESSPTLILRKKFPKLQTFVLHVCNVGHFLGQTNPGSNSRSYSYDMASAPDLERLGVDLLKACPTLLRTAIGAEPVQGQELSCVLTRSNGAGLGSAIHAEAGTALDFDALDMFWNP